VISNKITSDNFAIIFPNKSFGVSKEVQNLETRLKEKGFNQVFQIIKGPRSFFRIEV
jgi:hypothetical protein